MNRFLIGQTSIMRISFLKEGTSREEASQGSSQTGKREEGGGLSGLSSGGICLDGEGGGLDGEGGGLYT